MNLFIYSSGPFLRCHRLIENENLKKQNNLRDEVKNNQEELDTTPDYISAINDIKNNSVPKESYDKLREENKKLINALSTRQPESQETPKEDPIDLNKLREKTFKGECTNLEFIENSFATEIKELLAYFE